MKKPQESKILFSVEKGSNSVELSLIGKTKISLNKADAKLMALLITSQN